jgi:mycothiol system anti-sigma-R factor
MPCGTLGNISLFRVLHLVLEINTKPDCMNLCDDLHVDLLRYLDNDLGEQELKYFRAHLDTCTYCQGRLEQERALSRFLRESRPLYSAPAELRSQITTTIEGYSARDRSQWGWLRRRFPLISSWKMLAPAALVVALCLIAVPNIVQNVRAASYAKAAVANHNRYLNHELTPGIRTSSPEAVIAWFADKLPFQFRLPSSEAILGATPAYELAGASLVAYRGTPAAMVLYKAPSGIISLLIESSEVAVVAGGDEIHYGVLTFHYRNEGSFKVITWSVHNLSYALVSSITSSARESCLVCHQDMADHGQFRMQ